MTILMSVYSLRCTNTIKKGPYTIGATNVNIVVPYKFLAHVVRTKDLEGGDKTSDELILPCYKEGEYKKTACYDHELGNYIEFKTKTVCIKEIWYHLKSSTGGIINERNMNLTSTNMDNLQSIVMAEHALNEDLRINFGLAVKEILHTREILRKTILSVAKIDDKLLGTILNNQARSQFLNEDKFYLIPCEKSGDYNSNCKMDMVFKAGRWELKTNKTICSNITKAGSINIFQSLDLTAEKSQQDNLQNDFDGWTFFIDEQNKLIKRGNTIYDKQQKLYDITGDIYKTFKNLILEITLCLLIGFTVLILWTAFLHKKIAAMNTTTTSHYVRMEVIEPETTCTISNEPGELRRILQSQRTAV